MAYFSDGRLPTIFTLFVFVFVFADLFRIIRNPEKGTMSTSEGRAL